MSEQRTASEIRAYLKAMGYGLAIAKTPRKKRAYYCNLGIALRVDLPRLLDTAVKARKILLDLVNFGDWNIGPEGDEWLNETAWLDEEEADGST